MLVNGRNFDVERAIHDISLEAAKIEVQLSERKTSDVSEYLDRLFNSYVYNFAYLSEKTDDEIRKLLEDR